MNKSEISKRIRDLQDQTKEARHQLACSESDIEYLKESFKNECDSVNIDIFDQKQLLDMLIYKYDSLSNQDFKQRLNEILDLNMKIGRSIQYAEESMQS